MSGAIRRLAGRLFGPSRVDPGESRRPLKDLAPGVVGWTTPWPPDSGEGDLHVELTISLDPGQGNVTRFIDSLPRDRRVVCGPNINPVMAAMYARRGFHAEDDPLLGMRWWVRDPAPGETVEYVTVAPPESGRVT